MCFVLLPVSPIWRAAQITIEPSHGVEQGFGGNIRDRHFVRLLVSCQQKTGCRDCVCLTENGRPTLPRPPWLIPRTDWIGAIRAPAATAATAGRTASKGSVRASGNSVGRFQNPPEAAYRLQIFRLWKPSHTRDRTSGEYRFAAKDRLQFHAHHLRRKHECGLRRGLATSARGSERISSRTHP